MGYMHQIKEWVEARTGLHIFRSTLPLGTNLFHDLKRSGLWPEKPLILDVGAHLGETALSFLQHSPLATMHCFEPSQLNYGQLQKKLADWKNATPWKIALSNRNGTASLHLKESSTTHSLVIEQGSKEVEEVEVQTLDAFCDRLNIAHIHFLKIDTEGGDLDVLKGVEKMLGQNKIDFIQVETSLRKETLLVPFKDVEEFMSQHAYELFAIYDQQQCWNGRQSLLYLNAVYVRTSLVSALPAT